MCFNSVIQLASPHKLRNKEASLKQHFLKQQSSTEEMKVRHNYASETPKYAAIVVKKKRILFEYVHILPLWDFTEESLPAEGMNWSPQTLH